MHIGYFSKKLGDITGLPTLLGASIQQLRPWSRSKRVTHIAGWGLKPTTTQARAFAQSKALPYLSLEDGFLRSLGLGINNAPLHSLIVDHSGIYYDATRPSDLETRILRNRLNDGQIQRARNGIDLLRRYRLSKYNHAPDVPLTGLQPGVPRVLVVDQTAGDASITYGMATADHFADMMEAAIKQNPEAEILVKVHPDVIAGKKKGHLLEQARHHNCRLITEDINPWALLDTVDHVYVVTSQLGFEALMAGKVVHCFGMPFYAGWGLTQDRQSCERRGQARSLEALFHAAYFDYCRYLNPYTGERCQFEDTVYLIADQKRMRDRFAGNWLAEGFSRWKQRFIGRFLGPAAKVRWGSHTECKEDECVLVWASQFNTVQTAKQTQLNSRVWRIEDGFVRSVGLGVDLVDPLSLVLDSRGIYYDATMPSDLEYVLEHAEITQDLLQRASRLIQQLVELKLSKYNIGTSRRLQLPTHRHIILVPGQVETDASIRTGSPQLRTNLELLQAVRSCNPDAFIIYKPHPDVLSGARVGNVASDEFYDLEVRDIAMPVLLEQVNEVHTLTSLTGFEALLRGIPVVTWGLPFYAGWGLTEDKITCSRRTRQRTLDELVAATLLLYPTYVDPQTGDLINAETAVTLLNRGRETRQTLPLRSHVWRKLRRPQ